MTARARTLATIFIGLAIFAASLPAFYPQVFGTRISDIPAHFSIGSTDAYARYSILYLLVQSLLSIGANEPVMGWVAIVLLSTFVAFKAALNFRVLSEESKGLILPTCVAVVLTFAMPIMNWWNYHSVYLGQIAPTIWHNSTTILEMPVAILLFYAGLRCLEESNFRNSVLVSGLRGAEHTHQAELRHRMAASLRLLVLLESLRWQRHVDATACGSSSRPCWADRRPSDDSGHPDRDLHSDEDNLCPIWGLVALQPAPRLLITAVAGISIVGFDPLS